MAKGAKARKPSRPDPRPTNFATAVSQPGPRSTIQWTPGLLRQALRRADGGDMTLVADLCDQIVADDRFGELLGQLADDVIGCDLTFEADLRSVVGSARKAKEIEVDWATGYDDDELKSLIVWGLVTGVSFAKHEIWKESPDKKSNPRRVVPVTKWWHPQHFAYLAKDGLSGYSIGGDQSNHSWHVREAGTGNWLPIRAGDGTWIIETRRSEYRPWANGLWRGLGAWWLLKQYAIIDSGVHSEKASKTVVTADPTSTIEERREIAQYVYEAGKDGVIALPPGFDIKQLEITANLEELYHAQIRLANDSAAIAILGQNLSTNVTGGSFAATKEHSKKESRRVRNAAQMLSKTLQGQSLSWWAEFNFGDATLAPYPYWHTEPDEDFTAKATTLLTLTTALKTARDAGYELDEGTIEEEYGVVLKKSATPPPSPTPTAGVPAGVPPTDPKVPAPKPVAPKVPKAHPQAFLASGDNPAAAKGFVQGQLYVDDLSDKTAAHAADELAGWLERLLAAVNGAVDYEDARYRIIKAFQAEADPSRLAMLVERGILLADLAGRFAVQEDAQEE